MKRVLIIDDSVFIRKLLKDIVNQSGEFTVAGVAINGRDALRQIHEIEPDVITLDVEMPVMNGLETLGAIMKQRPTPVVMLSSLTTKGASTSIAALQLGAVDVVAKPIVNGFPQLQEIAGEIIAKLRAAAAVNPARLVPTDSLTAPVKKITRTQTAGSTLPVVMIAASTGGPRALRQIIPQLHSEVSAFYFVIQHLPVGFTKHFAQDLDKISWLNVREAEEGDTPKPDTLLVAPAGKHSAFTRGGKITLTEEPPLWGVRPAADIPMCTAAEIFGSRVVGAVLTGMGRDGAHGLLQIKKHGGRTLAEDQTTCVIYGMPKAAAENGAAQQIVKLDDMPAAIAASAKEITLNKAA